MGKFESKIQNCYIEGDGQLFQGWRDAQVIDCDGAVVYRGNLFLANLDGYAIVPRSKYPGGDPVTKLEKTPMEQLSHDQVRALKVGDRLHLIYFRDDEKKEKEFEGVVTVDDVSDMDISCCLSADAESEDGSYVSIMLQAPDGSGKPWPLDKAPGRGWFEFFAAGDTNK